MTVGALWRRWRDELARVGIATATLDAKLLVGHVLGFDTLQMSLREGELVSISLTVDVTKTMQRRLSGESVARIIGRKEFYGLDFELNAETLEPRPDTELLVDLALAALPRGGRLVDLGTGTGCIPISILVNRPDASGVATDINPLALEMAQRNAGRHGVEDRLIFRQGDWFGALATSGGEDDPPGSGERAFNERGAEGRPPHPARRADPGSSPEQALAFGGRGEERFDLILSNPPYISSAVVETLSPEVKDFDPRLALDGGPDGLAPYRIISGEAANWLRPGGKVLVEIGYDQGEAVSELFGAAGFTRIAVHKDLSGLDRVVCAHHIC